MAISANWITNEVNPQANYSQSKYDLAIYVRYIVVVAERIDSGGS